MSTNPIGGPRTPPPANNPVTEDDKETENKAKEQKGFVLGGNNIGRAADNDNVPKKKSIFDRARKVNSDNNASVRPQVDGDSEIEG